MRLVRSLLFFVCLSMSFESNAQGYGSQKGFVPANGFVPDADTAIRIAEAVLVPIYTKAKINSEKPFTGQLRDDVWIVRGHMPAHVLGGVVEAHVSKTTGTILFVLHGQ